MVRTDFAIDAPGSLGTNASAWRADSLCRPHPTRWWFAGDPREALVAKSICSGCPVKGPCLEFALSRPDVFGIWAATTASERTTIRRDLRSAGEVATEDPAPPMAESKAPMPRVQASTVVAATVVVSEIVVSDIVVSEVVVVTDPSTFVDDADLLTPAEAARKLGVTPNTVTRWSRAGKISAIQTMGGHRRFRRGEIERVLRDGGLATAI